MVEVILLVVFFVVMSACGGFTGAWFMGARYDNDFSPRVRWLISFALIGATAVAFFITGHTAAQIRDSWSKDQQNISGPVERVSTANIERTGHTSLVIGDQSYSCGNMRCALLEPGDFVELTCQTRDNTHGAPWRDCAFVRSDAFDSGGYYGD